MMRVLDKNIRQKIQYCRKRITRLSVIVLSVVVLLSCSREDGKLTLVDDSAIRDLALRFTQELVDREYDKAYSRTTAILRQHSSFESFVSHFETIVPKDWGPASPLEIAETRFDWPEKNPQDIMWVYVSIGGDVYSEAITLIVTKEVSAFKISHIEYGRP